MTMIDSRPFPITLHPEAAEMALKIMEEEGQDPSVFYVRISIMGGGCMGIQQNLDFDDCVNDWDYTDKRHGVMLVIDQISAYTLDGATLECGISMDGIGFVFKGLDKQGMACGCGSSLV